MKMNYLTVGELIERLSKFDKNLLVELCGGEGGCGDWAEVTVGVKKTKTCKRFDGSTYEAEYFEGEVIMDY